MSQVFIVVCTIFLYIFGTKLMNEIVGGIAAFIYLIYALIVYKKEKEEEAINEKKKQIADTKLKEVKDGELTEVQVNNLILQKGEKCYYAEKVFIGMLYITNKRVILASDLKEKLDKSINEVTFLQAFTDALLIQFGTVGHKIPTENAVAIREIILKLAKEKINESEELICEYCGMFNNRENKICSNCGGPLKRK